MNTSYHHRWRGCAAVALCGLLLAAPPLTRAQTATWMEPQALNIVDLVGQVPDAVLEGLIISWDSGGISRFVSSSQDGDWVHIRVLLDTRRVREGAGWVSRFNLLGQRPVADHMPSATPESWVHVYDGTHKVTEELTRCDYVEPPRSAPPTDASAWARYPYNARTLYAADMPSELHGRHIPANIGGELTIPGDRPVLTAVFTVRRPTAARVTYLGTQEAAFHSFVGPCSVGDMGGFGALVYQLWERYPVTRHTRIRLEIPARANYVLLNYRPMDYDIYSGQYDDPQDPQSNLFRPIAGTVRLAPDDGMLSQNLNFGGAFPLRVAWQDADQSAGPFLSLLPPVDRITPPEFFVLPDTPYDPCFREGGCSAELLDAIYNDTEPLRISYLEVVPTVQDAEPVVLKAADDPRLPVTTSAAGSTLAPAGLVGYRVYVPSVTRQVPRWENAPRPSGIWESVSARMVGYLY